MDRKINIYGFGIFEILVVIVILGILMSFAYRQIIIMVQEQRLRQATNMVISDLEKVKLNSISKDTLWGIIADNNANNYILFKDTNGNCSFDNGEVVSTIDLPAGISFGNDVYFLFDRKGYPRNASCGLGPASIIVKNQNNTQKVIVVDRYGRIYIQ